MLTSTWSTFSIIFEERERKGEGLHTFFFFLYYYTAPVVLNTFHIKTNGLNTQISTIVSIFVYSGQLEFAKCRIFHNLDPSIRNNIWFINLIAVIYSAASMTQQRSRLRANITRFIRWSNMFRNVSKHTHTHTHVGCNLAHKHRSSANLPSALLMNWDCIQNWADKERPTPSDGGNRPVRGVSIKPEILRNKLYILKPNSEQN